MKFKYMDPDDIVSVVVVLITLAVGIYAFFVTMNAIPKTGTGHASQEAINNTTKLGGTVFNILGVVITIGAIMSIIGVIYGYLRPRY